MLQPALCTTVRQLGLDIRSDHSKWVFLSLHHAGVASASPSIDHSNFDTRRKTRRVVVTRKELFASSHPYTMHRKIVLGKEALA